MQKLKERVQVTVTEQANWQAFFLRESGWKCKALQSQLERLCVFHHFDQSAWGCLSSFRNSENIYWPVHCHPRIQNMHNQERMDLSCSSEKSLKRKPPSGQRVRKYEGAARQFARMCSISGAERRHVRPMRMVGWKKLLAQKKKWGGIFVYVLTGEWKDPRGEALSV